MCKRKKPQQNQHHSIHNKTHKRAHALLVCADIVLKFYSILASDYVSNLSIAIEQNRRKTLRCNVLLLFWDKRCHIVKIHRIQHFCPKKCLQTTTANKVKFPLLHK